MKGDSSKSVLVTVSVALWAAALEGVKETTKFTLVPASMFKGRVMPLIAKSAAFAPLIAMFETSSGPLPVLRIVTLMGLLKVSSSVPKASVLTPEIRLLPPTGVSAMSGRPEKPTVAKLQKEAVPLERLMMRSSGASALVFTSTGRRRAVLLPSPMDPSLPSPQATAVPSVQSTVWWFVRDWMAPTVFPERTPLMFTATGM